MLSTGRETKEQMGGQIKSSKTVQIKKHAGYIQG